MELHVIRHTPINFDKHRCYGRLDVPLADSFAEDVEKIRKLLDDEFDVVYSSPKKRCTQLASSLGFKNIELEERLLELDFGEWEGKLWNEINPEALNDWMSDFVNIPPSKGESLDQMYRRVSHFLDSLRKESYHKVLIITHSGVIRCLMAYFLEFPLKNTFRIPVAFHEHFIFNLSQNRELDSIIQLK